MITVAPPDAFEQEVERLVEVLPRPNPIHGYRQILLAHDDGSDGAKAALDRVAAVTTNETTVTVITVIPFESIGASPDPIRPELRDWHEGHRYEATQALRQVLNRAVAWELLDANPAKQGVPNPLRCSLEKRPFDSWEQLESLAAQLGPVYGPMVIFAAATSHRAPASGTLCARAARHRSP